MKQVLAGLGLLAGAGIATVALAPAGNADPTGGTWVELEAAWSPNPAEPGEEVTLTPEEGCAFDVDGRHVAGPGEVLIYLEGVDEPFSVEMAYDGTWEFAIEAPTEPGVYRAVAECRNDVWAEEIGWCKADPNRLPPGVSRDDEGMFELISSSKPAAPTWEFFDCKFEYYRAELTVGGDETPPTTAPPVETPPPATPIVKPPDVTG
jgi:hypothetical protein